MKIGVLGGGQLGRMLGLAGLPLGMSFRFLDPAADSPAREVGELLLGNYDDPASLEKFVKGVEVVTFEFENVPADTLHWLDGKVCTYPGTAALDTGQDRAKEKGLFSRLGIPVPEYAIVQRVADIAGAAEKVGTPCVVKTLRLGYDGKGQETVGKASDAVVRGASVVGAIEAAWRSVGGQPVIVERMVPFEREISIIGVRSRSGECVFYAPTDNVHTGGILRRSIAPAAGLSEAAAANGREYVRKIMNALGHVGVLAVEFFVVNGELLANELAPRVHNSGHWTIEGAVTSQFENHLRAVCGLALGPCDSVGVAGMVNLIGEGPSLEELAKIPGARVHFYGKKPRPGRKIGHVTLVAANHAELGNPLERLSRLVPGALPS